MTASNVQALVLPQLMRAAFPVNSVLVSICLVNNGIAISLVNSQSHPKITIKCPGTGLTTVNEGSISSKKCVSKYLFSNISSKHEGAQWLSGRVLDWRQRDRGFEPQRRHCVVVLEQDTFILA